MKPGSLLLQLVLIISTIYVFYNYPSGFEVAEKDQNVQSLTEFSFVHDPKLHHDETNKDPDNHDHKGSDNTNHGNNTDTKNPDDKKPNTKPTDPKKDNPDSKNPDPKKPDDKKPDDKKPDDNKPPKKESKKYTQINAKIASCEKCESECHQRPIRQLVLCNIGAKNNCIRRYIVEEVHTFWIISPIYSANYQQTGKLYHLHRNFRNFVKAYGINFQTVEVIFPGQDYQVTEPNNEPYDIQFKDEWIFCMRENLVNVGMGYLPDDWQFMAWIDQHIWWEDPYWFEKAMWLMSHYNIVHLLNGNDFWDAQNKTMYHLDGFARIWTQVGNNFWMHDPRQCGCAWSMRREIYEKLGGILDICIGTKCDLYQNYAFAGLTYTSQISNQEYANEVGNWQRHAIEVFQRKMWFLDSKIIHFMHCDEREGCRTSDYNAQVYALMRHNYNPKTDLTRDPNKRLRLTGNIALAREMWAIYGGPSRSRILEALREVYKDYPQEFDQRPDNYTT